MTTTPKTYRAQGTWVVRAGGAVLGESRAAVELIEGDLPPVIFFPRSDLAMAFFEPSATTSVCPRKGKAEHFTIVTKSARLRDAAFSYATPGEGLSAIAGYVAFAAEHVTVERV
jgi:uncharacterized protein (DUF427 family)